MKASLKFREDPKNPILRAKIPLNVFGFPFQSGIEAGDFHELCLSFSTLFDAGPVFKFSYRPNDSWRPFGGTVKTGVGLFGSPVGVPMTMSAEFNFLGNGSPSFFLHFKPRIGDLSIKKSFNSSGIVVNSLLSEIKSDENGIGLELAENNETPMNWNWSNLFSGERISGLPVKKTAERLISGAELYATTAVPLRNRAVVKFRWSVTFPVEISFRNMPYLTLSKIGIEHMAKPECSLSGSDDVAGACLAAKRELDVLKVESVLLRKELAELRSDISVAGEKAQVAGGDSGRGIEVERNNDRSSE